MANVAALAVSAVSSVLTSPVGAEFQLDTLAQSLAGVPSVSFQSVITGNTSPELLDQSLALPYPTVLIYCEKFSNTLKEKFRVFSGTALVIVEIRHTQDQIQGLQDALEVFVAATCEVLDNSRGDWGNGLFYRGGYQVGFGPTKRGGKSVLQIARVSVEVDISI